MREYNRIMDEQEEQRAEELQARMDRQKNLMEKLQANVSQQAKAAGDNDAMRAKAQADEMDTHYAEAEKDGRKNEEKDLQNIQSQILEADTAEYNEIEREKLISKKMRNWEHRKEIEGQIQARSRQSVPDSG